MNGACKFENIHTVPRLQDIGLPPLAEEDKEYIADSKRWIITSNKESLSIPTWGINLGYLLELVKACGGRESFASLTTANISSLLVQPLTVDHQGSVCDVLIDHERYDAVQPANWFVSHAWQYDFMDTLDALTSFFEDQDIEPGKVFLWIDLFCLSQHQYKQEIKPFEWWQTTFMTAVKTIRNVVMVLQPWDDPISLKRAWCILEVLACDVGNGRFHIALSPSENKRLLKDLLDGHSHDGMLSNVNSEKSNATNPDDRDQIFQAINMLTNFETLDRLVLKTYNASLIKQIQKQVDKKSQSGLIMDTVNAQLALITLQLALGQYEDARTLSEEALKACGNELDKNHPTTIMALLSLGTSTHHLGKYNDAEVLLGDCLERCVDNDNVGEDHMLTLKTKNALARLYLQQSKYNEGEAIATEAYKKSTEAFGQQHVLTVTIGGTLARIYQSKGANEEAESLLLHILEVSSQLRGDEHPETLRLANMLGGLYWSTGKFPEAKEILTDLIARQRRLVGPNHFDTLKAMSALGSVYDTMGQYKESEVLKVEVLERIRATFGPDHAHTATMLNNLSSLYTKLHQFHKAEALILECLEIRRRTLGPNHASTLSCAKTLGSAYQQQNKFTEAQVIFTDAWTRLKEHFGVDFPETLQMQFYVGQIYLYMDVECDEYEDIITDCMERMERVFGSEHIDTLLARRLYGSLLNKSGDYDRSVKVLTNILERLKRMDLGNDDEE
ncbi:Kinesin light chain 3, partial [Blyttiomyces sp. JEL0837]